MEVSSPSVIGVVELVPIVGSVVSIGVVVELVEVFGTVVLVLISIVPLLVSTSGVVVVVVFVFATDISSVTDPDSVVVCDVCVDVPVLAVF